MFGFEVFGAVEIRNCPCYFQNAIVATRREAELGDRVFHNLFAVGSQHAVLANVTRAHLGVGINVLVEETAQLRVACRHDAMANRFGGLRAAAAGEMFGGNSGSSSRNKTPLWDMLTSPGRGMEPPPTRPASDIV